MIIRGEATFVLKFRYAGNCLIKLTRACIYHAVSEPASCSVCPGRIYLPHFAISSGMISYTFPTIP